METFIDGLNFIDNLNLDTKDKLGVLKVLNELKNLDSTLNF